MAKSKELLATEAKKRRTGWKNPASARNALLAGRPEKEDLLAGLTNLETGEPSPGNTNTYFPSMKAAALALGVNMAVLKEARLHDCPAFRSSGNVHRGQIMSWMRKRKESESSKASEQPATEDPDDFIDDYDVADEAGSIGQTLKSLQAYERRAKRKLDLIEKDKTMHSAIKAEAAKLARDAWIKVVNALLKYDLNISQAKRESGELIPIAEAQEGTQGLLAWHTIAISDAMRNVFPQMEGKNKYEMAALWDKEARAAIYRNFKLGHELGKIPEWMLKTATDHVRAEKPLSLKPKVDLSGF